MEITSADLPQEGCGRDAPSSPRPVVHPEAASGTGYESCLLGFCQGCDLEQVMELPRASVSLSVKYG